MVVVFYSLTEVEIVAHYRLLDWNVKDFDQRSNYAKTSAEKAELMDYLRAAVYLMDDYMRGLATSETAKTVYGDVCDNKIVLPLWDGNQEHLYSLAEQLVSYIYVRKMGMVSDNGPSQTLRDALRGGVLPRDRSLVLAG